MQKHETKGIDSKTGKPWTKKKLVRNGLHLIAEQFDNSGTCNASLGLGTNRTAEHEKTS